MQPEVWDWGQSSYLITENNSIKYGPPANVVEEMMKENLEKTLDERWKALTLKGKMELFKVVNYEDNGKNADGSRNFFIALGFDVTRLIAEHLWDDPDAFLNFKMTCSFISKAAGSFEKILRPLYVRPFANRLVNRLTKLYGNGFSIGGRTVRKPRSRYLILSYDGKAIAKIDNLSGMIVTTKLDKARGWCDDYYPEVYFTKKVGGYGLSSTNQLSNVNMEYEHRLAELLTSFKALSEYLHRSIDAPRKEEIKRCFTGHFDPYIERKILELKPKKSQKDMILTVEESLEDEEQQRKRKRLAIMPQILYS